MLSQTIGFYGKQARDVLAAVLARYRFTPNFLTAVGLVTNVYAAVLFAQGKFFVAGFVLFVAGAFDILDGTLARLTKQATRFGAFLDSVIDRYSDIAVFLGIMIFYARPTPRQSLFFVILTGIAMMGSLMTSYTRARAESLIPQCRVGFLERPERLVLLIIGALTEVPWVEYNYFLHKMPAVLWVIAVLSNWTVGHRVYHTWKATQALDAEPSAVPDYELEMKPEVARHASVPS
jgi:CDP-diacylglycerol--glycerol-3-phosphate 3-phosphatidyltransferase